LFDAKLPDAVSEDYSTGRTEEWMVEGDYVSVLGVLFWA
jgi:hypothetical protein